MEKGGVWMACGLVPRGEQEGRKRKNFLTGFEVSVWERKEEGLLGGGNTWVGVGVTVPGATWFRGWVLCASL